MSIIQTLVEKFPIRKTKQQKAAFRAWFMDWAKEQGYSAGEEEAKGLFRSTNVIIGDPESAQAVFTAHYDTPPVMFMPNLITPCNKLFHLLYQLLMVPFLLLPGISLGEFVGHALRILTDNAELSSRISGVVLLIGVYTTLGIMMFGPANKNNVNDNTSGVAAVMELMKRIAPENRGKTAFILFDNEEKGLVGSAAYAKKHKDVKENTLIINMDCVGDGGNVLFFANKKTRELPVFPALEAAMQGVQGRNYVMNNLEKCVYPSDQKNFKCGVAVSACNKSKLLGYYCDKIHTAKDTVCEQSNLDFIADGLSDFVTRL